MGRDTFDAVVVGSGPNGLAAAITLAQAGRSVVVLESRPTVGGGMRSAELTLPGFVHDICSAIHPLGEASPFFRSLSLRQHGLSWIHPRIPLAHPLDSGDAALLERRVADTAALLGPDRDAYQRLIGPLVHEWEPLFDALLQPMIPPRAPIRMAKFGLTALRSAVAVARRFQSESARALFAGIAAHSVIPLEAMASASFGLTLGVLGHAKGWPFPRGGTQALAEAMASELRMLGGEIRTNHPVHALGDLPPSGAVFFDIGPHQLARLAGDRFPAGFRQKLLAYRYGPAAFKLDWALSGPIPWKAPECAQAGTIHVGGTLEEIAEGERLVAKGEHPERPFVLLAQTSLFDPTRAPAGKHTAWAYCHVPNGSTVDMTERIEKQIERFAPGFRDLILARQTRTPAQFAEHNPNYVGGDVVGGANDFWQFLARPMLQWNPYRTPVDGWYMCSAATPPGGGIHGMCGYNAARSYLRHSRGPRTGVYPERSEGHHAPS